MLAEVEAGVPLLQDIIIRQAMKMDIMLAAAKVSISQTGIVMMSTLHMLRKSQMEAVGMS